MAASAGIYTLGCRVNQYESEALAEKLSDIGVIVKDFSEKNDIYIINTCTVTAESDRKSRQIIRRAQSANPDAFIIVTGCMAENDRKRLSSMNGVDIICGNASKLVAVDAALDMLGRGEKNSSPIVIDESMLTSGSLYEPMRIRSFARTRAYVKIQDGCNGRCSYCIIPTVRGRSRSRPQSDILDEIKTLADNSCREVVLTGIETSDYEFGLADLAGKISEISDIKRIRFSSLDPSYMTEENVNELMSIPKCMPHFHISIQHGSDRILKHMRRRYLSDRIYDCVSAIRKINGDAMITADLITGFPGEDESDIEESARLIKEVRLLHSHIFTYSRRDGTAAAGMACQIPEAEKSRRSEYLESVQREVKEKLLKERVGRRYEMLAETVKDGIAHGHSRNFIEITAKADGGIEKNDIREVLIEAYDENGLIGRVI